MYDMYPDYTDNASEGPYSERGMSGLGHTESYPITVPVRDQPPKYPQGYQYLAEGSGAMTEVQVVEVREQ